MSSCAGAAATATATAGSSNNLSLDHHQHQHQHQHQYQYQHQQLPPPSSEQLCYVHCTHCDTVLAVSVPCSSLFKTVTVRCGHCANLLPVNLRALLLPPPATATSTAATNQYHLGHNLFSHNPHNLLGGAMTSTAPNYSLTQPSGGAAANYMTPTPPSRGGANELPRLPTNNRPPEKRQRVPSAYNRFIKEEIQRIKAGNPDISHREAFSAAAKNWAHFPHIHFGLMPDQTAKRTSNMRPYHPQY